MTEASQRDAFENLDPEVCNEVCDLFSKLCDDELQESDRRQLNQLLANLPEARRVYFRCVALHASLVATAGRPVVDSEYESRLAVERLAIERFAGQMAYAPSSVSERISVVRLRAKRLTVCLAMTLAAGFFLAISHSWRIGREEREKDLDNIAADIRDLPMVSIGEDVTDLVAEITFVSETTTWTNPSGSFAVASLVRSGEVLAIHSGQVELTYSSGTNLLLTGPSEFLVLPDGGKLRMGELEARVPEAGHGFTIETPQGKVVDLGTEFGVVVDDFGVSQVSVFEGKVETTPIGRSGDKPDTIQITSGNAIQWNGQAFIPISFQDRRRRQPAGGFPANLVIPPEEEALDDNFHGSSLNSDRWKSLGNVFPSENGISIGRGDDRELRPYLLSAKEYDPTVGEIRITCDLRFVDVRQGEDAAFAILTRCTDSRSTPGTPWHDMLACAVHCRIKADLQTGEVRLEAGTKFEADREISRISWGGFTRPLPDTLYHIEMRDDGLNISFTVSLAENPSVSKTISCRSLFRGAQNFFALEGSGSCTAIVERLVVHQDSPSVDENNRKGSHSLNPEAVAANKSQILNELTPRDAKLILHENFDDVELDKSVWTTLGDVVLKDGGVRLGLPNKRQHIDTWRARPYLLTKDSYDPSDGTLTILGSMVFAKNYLHGYGGSFAVLTRADDERGDGPGWENSILRRGVRSNYWPAADGFDHSFEIHEKPSINTISLLIAEGFSVTPCSRSYVFRVIDDSKSISMTFVDTNDPETRKTIHRPTSLQMTSGGRIGFESCWGSPVFLDDIHIFQSERPSH